MILFPVFLGVILGTVAGIVPGMHVNTLIPFLFMVFSNMDVTELAVLIVSTAMSEIFMNIIPSTFLGAPDTETALSVLPAHRLLFSGKGYEAVVITILSSLFSLLLTVLLVFLFYPFFVPLYTVTRPYLHFLLLTVIFFMIYSEKDLSSSIKALVVISLSGLFGTIVLNSKISTSNVLFPVLTGMFGMSGLLFSVSQNSTLPEQDYRIRTEINTFEFVKSVFLGSLAGIAIGFLPAIGISEAATMVRYLTKLDGERGFLATLGGINMGNEVFSLISLYLVGNPRSGASVAIGSLLPFQILRPIDEPDTLLPGVEPTISGDQEDYHRVIGVGSVGLIKWDTILFHFSAIP